MEKIEGIGWVLKKGLLPSCDLSFCVIDNMWPKAMDAQIESRRDGIVKVAGIKSGELYARTRLKLLSNPEVPFGELSYRCLALKMFDPKLIARFAFAVFTNPIPPDVRYDPRTIELELPEKQIIGATVVILRDNLSRETTFVVPKALWPVIMEKSKELEERFGVEDIPLYVRNLPYKVSLLTYSFALLEGEEPAEKHVKLAHEWLNLCGEELELDKYKADMKTVNDLSDEEYDIVAAALAEEIYADLKPHGGDVNTSRIFKTFDYLVKHSSAQRNDLAAALDADPSTISIILTLPRGKGLLKSTKEGYTFTPKGVRFIRRWMPIVRSLGQEEFAKKYGLIPIRQTTQPAGQSTLVSKEGS